MPCEGYRVIYRVDPDTGNNDTAGEVLVLRVFGPGQAREAVVHGHARRTLKFPIRR
jgi:hypothetical protein